MKRLLIIALTVMTVTAVSVPVQAQNNEGGVSQGELAQILVKVLGLYRYLPANPTVQDAINLLVINKISPADGWEPNSVVTRAILARVIVQSLERQHEIADPDNPMSWINYLKERGVPLDRVSDTVDYVEPLKKMAAPNVFRITPDAIEKRAIYGEPDEPDYGADAEFIASIPVDLSDVIEIIRDINPPPIEPPPMTPN